jgi:hypothetical protein
MKKPEPANAGDSFLSGTAVAHSAGCYVSCPAKLGFRYTPPQALRYRPLRGLNLVLIASHQPFVHFTGVVNPARDRLKCSEFTVLNI